MKLFIFFLCNIFTYLLSILTIVIQL